MGKYKAKINSTGKEINKTKKIKNIDKNVLSDDQLEIRRLLIILFVVAIVIVGIYFITVKFVTNTDKNSNETQKGEISYNTVSVGMILNRPYSEYYVVIYDYNSTDASYLDSFITNYSEIETNIKVYSCDLSNALNNNYSSNNETGNTKAKTLSEFSFGEYTLLYIKDGKVSKYIEGTQNIINELNK